MALTLVSAPEVEPISLEEARLHCNVDEDDTSKDSLLALWITAARQKAEALTNRALITQTWKLTLDEFPCDGDIKITKPNVLSIVSVTYIDEDGEEQTLDPESYSLDKETPPGWLMPADGVEWHATDDVVNAVRITFTAGYGPEGSDVPAAIRAWMLMTIAYLYVQAEAIDPNGKAKEIPGRFVDSMLDPFIVYGL